MSELKFKVLNGPDDESIDSFTGRKLYRIEALKDFLEVKIGQKGGWVQQESNLAQEGNCWLYDDAKVWDDAKVSNDAYMCGRSQAHGFAKIQDQATMHDDATIWERAKLTGKAKASWRTRIYDYAYVGDNAQISDCAMIGGGAHITADVHVSGNAYVDGNARLEVYGMFIGGSTHINQPIENQMMFLTIENVTDDFNSTITFMQSHNRKIFVSSNIFKGELAPFEGFLTGKYPEGDFKRIQYEMAIEYAKKAFRER
jgi:carbonic anhydrase/acetyltransferase-like protein (isoleucine patch superfamily)